MANTTTRRWSGLLPVASPETAPFWDACNRNVYLVQRCGDCGKVQHEYRGFCCHCWSSRIHDVPIDGRGEVWTYSVVMVNRTRGVETTSPYVVAVVQLTEGVKVITNIVDCEPADVRIGMPVRVTFAEADNGQRIPVFEPLT